MQTTVRKPGFLCGALQSYITRQVPPSAIGGLLDETHNPRPGDLILASIHCLGEIRCLEDHRGQTRPIGEDDLLILAYGNYQNLEFYDAISPERLELSDLVTSAGLVSSITCWHHTLGYPTRIAPIGFLANSQGGRLNLRDFGLRTSPCDERARTYVLMGAGEDTLAEMVMRLARQGQRVGVLRISGESSAHQYESLRQHGARWVVDFADAGFSSTYLLASNDLLGIFLSLHNYLCTQGATTVVVEVQGPLKQRESRLLIGSPLFRATVDGMLIAGKNARYGSWEGDHNLLPIWQMPDTRTPAVDGVFRS